MRILLSLIALLTGFPNGTVGDTFAETRAKADKGEVDAQYSLGTLYANGQGVAQDYAEAAK